MPGATTIDRAAFDAVSLDIGGVMVLPDHGVIAHALQRAKVVFDRSRFTDGHYYAMAELDRQAAEPETFGDYYRGFLTAVGVVEEDELDRGAEALVDVLVPPLWHQRIPGAMDAARRLLASGIRLGVTSNADGTIEDSLRRHEILQVGPGPGVEVEHITDSGVLGVHKPDPATFMATADGMGLAPERICHIGDSAIFDAQGAAAVGMVAVHVDPLGLCPSPKDSHYHVASLAELTDHIAQ